MYSLKSPEIADIADSEFSCVLHCQAAPLIYTAVAYLVDYRLKFARRDKKSCINSRAFWFIQRPLTEMIRPQFTS